MAKDESMSGAICDPILALGESLILVALVGSKMAEIASSGRYAYTYLTKPEVTT